MLSFALPNAAAPPTTAEVGERRKRQRTTAEELEFGLAFAKSTQGCWAPLWSRPPLIQVIQQDRLPAGTTRECRPWWRCGNSLVRTDIDVETDMVESGSAVNLKMEPLVDGGLPDAGATFAAKKTYQHVPDEAKEWFLHFHAYQKSRVGWPLTR